MAVSCDPPVDGREYQRFGLELGAVSKLLLETRYQGYTLFPVPEWLADVYVQAIRDDSVVDSGQLINEGQVAHLAWGLLYSD